MTIKGSEAFTRISGRDLSKVDTKAQKVTALAYFLLQRHEYTNISLSRLELSSFQVSCMSRESSQYFETVVCLCQCTTVQIIEASYIVQIIPNH
jgi:hypothetical protein